MNCKKVNCKKVGFWTFLAVGILGAILGWAVFPPVVKSQIKDNVIIVEGTEQFDRWVELPQPLHFKVHIFNITNADDVLDRGELAEVQELGPYIFKQYRKKRDIDIGDDTKTASYYQDQFFEYDSVNSLPFTLDDPIYVLSMHINGVLLFAEKNQPALVSVLSQLLIPVFGTDRLIMKTTPRELMFGGIQFCTSNDAAVQLVCNMIKAENMQVIREAEDGSLYFSMFNHKNFTDDGRYKIDTGVGDVYQSQQILEWKNLPYLETWKGGPESVCNKIEGTDSSYFPPYRTKESEPLYTFSSDICRSVFLVYDGEEEYEGIPGLRFRNTEAMLTPTGEEECFCVDDIKDVIKQENGCLYPGALDLSTCLGAPAVLTNPHMMDTSEEYTSLVKGFKPDRDKHSTFVLLEPNTGNPLRGAKRVQFNMFLRKVEGVTATENIRTALLPLMWVDEGINLNEEMVDMLKSKLINILKALNIIHWLLFIGGLVLAVCFGVWFWKTRNSAKMDAGA